MNTTTKTTTMICPRCAGNGGFKEYSGIWGGTCFKCEGAGVVPYKAPTKARKPSKAQVEKEAARLVRAADNKRKTEAAMAMYANDSRLTVGTDHAWYHAHATALAEKDGIWATL